MILHHLTLNTGHLRESPRAEVGDGIVKKLRPTVVAEVGMAVQVPAVPDVWVTRLSDEQGGAIVTIGDQSGTCGVFVGVAWSSASDSII